MAVIVDVVIDVFVALGRCVVPISGIQKRIFFCSLNVTVDLSPLQQTLINRFLGWSGTNGIIRYWYIVNFFFVQYNVIFYYIILCRDPTLWCSCCACLGQSGDEQGGKNEEEEK